MLLMSMALFLFDIYYLTSASSMSEGQLAKTTINAEVATENIHWQGIKFHLFGNNPKDAWQKNQEKKKLALKAKMVLDQICLN